VLEQWITAKQWVIDPFWPVIFTLIFQLLGLLLSAILLGRARQELTNSAGLADAYPREVALRITSGFALLTQMYTGLVPIFGVLAITAINAKVANTGVFLGVYATIFVILFVLMIVPAGSIEGLFEKVEGRPGLPRGAVGLRFDRLLKKIGVSSRGALLTYLLILLTLLIQFIVAYLQLPDARPLG
jgi:hypothetical protein